ncbi:unnamed protein product [Schistosoma margrebowiei]|uniref:Uncharacterized protein n=1 Tax=Schistosoma margrebowiei TaxID=48269 RepID=A0A183MX72_9TREM|nr:unnamed protein product [Schistosoma margrebowiei]
MSASTSRRSVFFDPLLFHSPSGFQVSARFVMHSSVFLNVYPIHFQHLFLISSSTESWFIISHNRLLLMVSGQRTFRMLCRQLSRSTCMVVVVLQFSAPYNRTVLTFVLNVLTLMLTRISLELHMFFSCRNVVFTLQILAFTSTSNPPCLPMLLPRYVKGSTSSRASPSSMIQRLLPQWSSSSGFVGVYVIEKPGDLRSPNRPVASNLSILFHASR